METAQETSVQSLREKIAAHRRRLGIHRAAAWLGDSGTMCGLRLRPLRLRTWTMLQATESRFLVGGTPLEGDIRNFLWYQSPLFMEARWWTVATFARWLALFKFTALLRWQRDVHWYSATIAVASADVATHLALAIESAQRAERSGPAGPCLEAQLVHHCAATYGWSPARTAAESLPRLLQLLAAATPRPDDDPAEREIRFAHLKKRNEELAPERARLEAERKAKAEAAAKETVK
jgi:hypothetical protein